MASETADTADGAGDGPRNAGRSCSRTADLARRGNSAEHWLTAVIAGSVAVMVGILASPLYHGTVATFGDMGNMHLPVRVFYAQCLRSGVSFDWMPQLFGGFFVSAEGEHAMYHPLHWLLYRWLPVPAAFDLELVFPVVLLTLGTVVFLRRHVRSAAAWMGGLMYAFSVIVLQYAGHPQFQMVLAHMPWALAAIDLVATTASPVRRRLGGMALALLTGSQILAGHPQAFWFSLLAEASYALVFLAGHRAPRATWTMLAAGMVLGLALGAVQWMTTLDALAHSTRPGVDLAFKLGGSLPLASIQGLLAPCLAVGRLPAEPHFYCNVVPLILALWWVTAHRLRRTVSRDAARGCLSPTAERGAERPDSRYLMLWACAMEAVSLWLSFGSYGKLYYLQTQLPMIGNFRVPARYLMLTQFGICVVAASAFDRLLNGVERGEKTHPAHLVLPAMAVAGAAWLAFRFAASGLATPTTRFQGQFYSGPVMFGLAVLGLAWAASGRRAGLFILALVAIFDGGLWGVGNDSAAKICWRTHTMPYGEYLASRPGPPGPAMARLYDTTPGFDRLWLSGQRLMNGYSGGLAPQRQLDYRHVGALRVGQVAWYRDPWHPEDKIAGLAPPIAGGWRAVPRPLPRVRLVSRALASQNPGEDLKNINVDDTALLTHPCPLEGLPPGTASLIEDRPGRMAIACSAPGRQLLVVSECFDSGWQATDNGRPIPVEQVNGDFMGCVVERGKHRIEFRFAPGCLRLGWTISLVSIALAFAGLGLAGRC